jgi:hypothetical protein
VTRARVQRNPEFASSIDYQRRSYGAQLLGTVPTQADFSGRSIKAAEGDVAPAAMATVWPERVELAMSCFPDSGMMTWLVSD